MIPLRGVTWPAGTLKCVGRKSTEHKSDGVSPTWWHVEWEFEVVPVTANKESNRER